MDDDAMVILGTPITDFPYAYLPVELNAFFHKVCEDLEIQEVGFRYVRVPFALRQVDYPLGYIAHVGQGGQWLPNSNMIVVVASDDGIEVDKKVVVHELYHKILGSDEVVVRKATREYMERRPS